MKLERYTFKIQGSFARKDGKAARLGVYPKARPDTKELTVYFLGHSSTDMEEGKRKDKVKVSRHCYCIGNAWSVFLSKKKQDALKKLSEDAFMEAYRQCLRTGQTVIVEGYTLPELGDKSMLVTNIEVVLPEQKEEEFFHPTYGFQQVELEF